MQFTVEDLSSVKKVLHIEIPEAEITSEIEKAYSNLKKTSKIKGFRPGKAPRRVLQRIYQKEVHADITSRLIQTSLVEALKQTDMNVIGEPQIDPSEIKENSPYRYQATIEITPEIADIDFKGIELKKTVYPIVDEEIETQLKMLQKKMARMEPVSEARPCQQGDHVIVDYEGFKDGQAYDEVQKTENFTLKIGDGHILKAFDEGIIGMQAGETRRFDVQFPEDYFNKALAGQTIEFAVTLKEIRKEVLPEIDDEFSKHLGPYENLDAVKAAIRNNLETGYAKRTEQELNEQIFQALIAKSPFEVPDTLVRYELEGILDEAERAFTYHNMSLEEVGQTREKLAEKYRDTAEKQVRRYLLLNKIIGQENLSLSDDELQAGIAAMAQASNQSVEEIKKYYQENPERLNFFKHALLEKNAINLIIQKCHIEEIAPQRENPAAAPTGP
ncbi:MAG: trigger factor [Desulfobacterales bacterium]